MDPSWPPAIGHLPSAIARTTISNIQAACLLFLLLTLAAQSPSFAADPAGKVQTFTVATFNILYRNLNLTNIAATIRAAQAEVVALQETNPESERFLRRALSAEFPHQEYRAGDRLSNGLGLLARHPIRQSRYLPPKHGAYGGLAAVVDLGGRPVQMVVVHLQSPRLGEADGPLGMVKVFTRMEVIHAQEMEYLHRETATNLPTIYLGDFNSLGGGNALRYLAERGWVDSAASVHPQPDQQVTWRARTLGRDWSFRIDYIFHSKEMVARECRVITSEASDHDLVVSRLIWKRE